MPDSRSARISPDSRAAGARQQDAASRDDATSASAPHTALPPSPRGRGAAGAEKGGSRCSS